MGQPDEEAALEWCVDQFGEDGSRFSDAEPFEWSEPDIEFLEDGTLTAYLEDISEGAFRQGVIGFAQDMFIQGRPWPFDIADIEVPILVAHGELDEIVPLSHSRDIVDRIPQAELSLHPEHGHVSLLRKFPALIDDALSMAS
jgi:pimeloyl-ACP methyl ester carboxylesterase